MMAFGIATACLMVLAIAADQRDQIRKKKHNMVMASEKSTPEADDILKEALPPALQKGRPVMRLLGAMQRHHKWVAIVLHYSPHYPRFVRVLSLCCGVIVMLFMQAVLYTTSTQPDDGWCAQQTSEQICLSAKSAFNSAYSKCYWDVSDDTCHFRQPPRSIEGVLLVMIFATLMGCPLDSVCDFLITRVLLSSSSTILKSRETAIVVPTHVHTGRSRRSAAAAAAAAAHKTSAETSNQRINHEWVQLVNELTLHRDSLPSFERNQFDGSQFFLMSCYEIVIAISDYDIHC